MTKYLTTILFSCACLLGAQAADWYVPGDGALATVVSGASSGDTVWVSDATYHAVELTVPAGVTVRSESGSRDGVVFDGELDYNAGRVVTMGAGSWLIAVTVTRGSLIFGDNGANVSGGSLSNCVLSGAFVSDAGGGGAYGSTLYNCTVTANWAGGPFGGFGAGLADCVAYNCEIYGNEVSGSGSYGGGVSGGTSYNCLIRNNTVSSDATGSGAGSAVLVNCTVTANDGVGMYACTVTNTISFGNGAADDYCNYSYSTTNDPSFIGGGNYRLQAGSIAIGTGTNGAWTLTTRDLDGNKRIWPSGGTVDIGCYEYGSQAEYPVPYILLLGTGRNAVAGAWGAVHGRRIE